MRILPQYIAFIVGSLLMGAALPAQAVSFNVGANANSSTGGTPLNTGLSFTAGQSLSITASPTDLWSAGALPRWSNANGLIGNLFATGSDESGQVLGTLIGQNFGNYTQGGFTAAYGSLIGDIGGTKFKIGTNFNATAPTTGVLSLLYWDENNGDNTNSILVNVNPSTAVPEPSSFLIYPVGAFALFRLRRQMSARKANRLDA
jgi:hypothetical protein